MLDYNSFEELTYENHPDLLVTHDLDRKDIIENDEMTAS
jgi:hypothetical protein